VSASGRSLVVIAALGVLIVLLIVLFPRVKPRADGSEGASTNASARNDTKPEETDPAVLTSEELIATALKSGAITYEESLIERAFAWFDDPRLRKEFRSRIVDWEAGGWLLDEIHRKEASLSQATLATLAPFRARPSDSASIFNQPRTDAVRALYAPAAQEWASALVPGGNGWTPLRIWIKGTAADLAPYLSNAKRMWASYHNFFVDPWEDDGDTTKDFNPDDAVDMYLLHVGQVDPRCASTPCSTAAATNGGWTSIAKPDRGRQCAGYAIVNLDQRHDEVIGAMAHELTHTAQRMYECADRYDFLTEGTATWVGYKVHFSETCDLDRPNLITNVVTTAATIQDDTVLPAIHTSLAAKGLLPAEHLVDCGYTDADNLLTSQTEHGVRIIGPVADDPSWQARANQGFAKANFTLDWDRQIAICPMGKQSYSWLPNIDATKVGSFQVRFSRADCSPCPSRAQCTKAKVEPRILFLLSQPEHEVLQSARQHQQTDVFREEYALRAGVESLMSQGMRAFDLRKARYIGCARTHLQHILIAVAINIVRLVAWWREAHQTPPRISAFARLATLA